MNIFYRQKQSRARGISGVISLLLAVCLLCGLLPAAQAAGTPDFSALVERAEAGGQTVVEVATPAEFAATVLAPCLYNGRYYVFQDPVKQDYGIVDVNGKVYPLRTTGVIELMTEEIVAVLEEDTGWQFYNIDGTLLCDNRYNIGEFAPQIDAVTGRADHVGAEGRTSPGSNQLLGIVINAKGLVLVADDIGRTYDGKIPFKKDKLWGVWDAAGKELIAPTYDELRFIGKDTILVQKDGAVWVQKLDGTVVIDKGYEALAYEERFVNGAPQPRRALMAKKDGKWGLVDHEGKILVPMQYDAIQPVVEEQDSYYLASAEDGDHLIRDDGTLDVPMGGTLKDYWNLSVLAEDRFAVYESEKKGTRLLDEHGNRLLDRDYDDITSAGGLFVCKQWQDGETHYAVYDSACKLLIPDAAGVAVTEQALIVGQADRVEVYSLKGERNQTIPGATLAAQGTVSPEVVLYRKNDQYAVAAPDGTPTTDYLYSEFSACGRTGAVNLRAEDGWHLLYDNGKPVVSGALDEAVAFSGGEFACYRQTDKYGFLQPGRAGTAAFDDVKSDAWYAPGVGFCFNAGLMKGVGGSSFAPNTTMTRAMLVQVLYNISGEPAEPHGFADVKPGAWYCDAVNWAAKNGVVSGTSETTFSPDSAVTREQMVTILFRYARQYGAKSGQADVLARFTDLARLSQWAEEPMTWAVENGVITGKENNTLDPGGSATRAEIATVLMRFVRLMAKAD